MTATAEPGLLGCQEPTYELVPEFSGSLLDEALELGERCGLVADPWQRRVLTGMLGLTSAGDFAAFRVGLNMPRQNGKGAVLEIRELAGVYLRGEKDLTHSSQQMDTSLGHMQRLVNAIEEGGLTGDLKAVRTGNGREAILFKSGAMIRFRTRSKTGGRGLTGELVVLDEAMFLNDFHHNVLVPTLATKAGQVIYAGSAADQHVHEHAIVWARLREEARKGENSELAYYEWSASYPSPDAVPETLDWAEMARANPALGIRISERHVRNEWASLDQRGRAVERLGVGDWPRTDFVQQTVVDPAAWGMLADAGSEIVGPVVFAFDVSPDRTAAVAAAGLRADGNVHAEIIQARKGTAWLAEWLAARVKKHSPLEVVCDSAGPVGSVMKAVDEAGVQVRTLDAGEHAAACGKFVDLVAEARIRHLDQPSLTAAIRGAATRPLGDAWLWSRKNSGVDISPLVAATLAVDAAAQLRGGDLFRIY